MSKTTNKFAPEVRARAVRMVADHERDYACLPPSIEAVVAGGAGSIPFRQVPPWRSRSQHPKDAVQHAAVIHTRHASGFVGQQRLDHAPLEVGQVISAHADLESEAGAM